MTLSIAPTPNCWLRLSAIAAASLFWAQAAQAQRADENAVRSASDAFGVSVGNERIGLYSDNDARGFSPVAAGNIRIEGLYIDNPTGFSSRLAAGSTLRVGITAQGYPFPAPTGLVDYRLRSVGSRPVITAAAGLGPLGSQSLSVDTQQPLMGGTAGFAGGLAYRRDEQFPGAADETAAIGGVLSSQVGQRLSVQAFASYFDLPSLRSPPQIFTVGSVEPPPPPDRNLSPDWVHNTASRVVYGGLASYALSEALTLRAGLFHIRNETQDSRTLLLRDVTASGDGVAFLAASADQSHRSTSGEIRLTWRDADGPFQQALHLSLRGRDAERLYGGGGVAALGPVNLYDDIRDLAEPDLFFGSRNHDVVRQGAIGLAYTGSQARWGELSLGLQRVEYEKTSSGSGRPDVVSKDSPWLYDASLSIHLTGRLSAYAGYTVGLEESPVAPESAVNRNEAPPALRTSQRDAGVRVRLPASLTLVAGVFDVQKPYFNLDPDRVYRELGDVTHRGVELSLTGSPVAGLTLVTGAVLLGGEVSGELVSSGRIGSRPVGQARRQMKLNADYRLPWHDDLSVDLGIVHFGDRAASAAPRPDLGGEQVSIDGRTTVDIGARWRFRLREANAVARLLVQNVADERTWDVAASGAYTIPNPRRVAFTVTADF